MAGSRHSPPTGNEGRAGPPLSTAASAGAGWLGAPGSEWESGTRASPWGKSQGSDPERGPRDLERGCLRRGHSQKRPLPLARALSRGCLGRCPSGPACPVSRPVPTLAAVGGKGPRTERPRRARRYLPSTRGSGGGRVRAGAVPGSLDRESLFTYGCCLVVQDLTPELLLGPSSHGPRGRGQARRAGHKRSFGRGQRTLRPCLPISASPAAVPPRPPANEVGKVQRNRCGSAEILHGCCSLGAEGTEGDAAGNLASRYPSPSDGNYPRAEAGGLRGSRAGTPARAPAPGEDPSPQAG